MNDRFLSLQLFIRVARTGGFSIAGREMGVSQPTASRIVAALEKKVGVALFTRTTRAVTLTEAGSDYLVRAEAILAALDEADHAARGTGELRGVLRVAVSTSFAVRSVLPSLSPFAEMHPKLRIEFILNDEKQDLVGEAVDVALRVGALADSSAVARKSGWSIAFWQRRPPISPGGVRRSLLPISPTTPSLSGRRVAGWKVGPSRRMGKRRRFESRGGSSLTEPRERPPRQSLASASFQPARLAC